MVDQVPRVILRTVDKTRLSSPEEGQADGVETRRIDHPAIVTQIALAVEHRDIEPAVVWTKTSGPDDGSDLAAREVEVES